MKALKTIKKQSPVRGQKRLEKSEVVYDIIETLVNYIQESSNSKLDRIVRNTISNF